MTIDGLCEVHCHIIPGVDDGSPDIETSLKMINMLAEQGAKAIILTPHYYSDSISLDDFLSRRNKAFSNLLKALPPDSPVLIPAAEVYMSKYLMNNDDLNRICIGDSGYALIEHPFESTFSQSTYDRLITLNCEHHITPILAHIERYKALMDDEGLLDEYIEMGCLVQVNISSFHSAPRHTRKKLIKYLNNGKIHLIGSDCHNLTTRPPEYEKGVKEIIKKCGEEALSRLEKNAQMLVESALQTANR